MSNISEYFSPILINKLGYILISVKPGMVLISLIYILLVVPSKKKSTLDNPLPSTTLKALIALSFIVFWTSSGKSLAISVLELLWYLAS